MTTISCECDGFLDDNDKIITVYDYTLKYIHAILVPATICFWLTVILKLDNLEQKSLSLKSKYYNHNV